MLAQYFPWLRGRKGVVALIATISAVLYTYWLLFIFSPENSSYTAKVINDVSYLINGFIAVICLFYAADKQTNYASRRAWYLIGLGFLASVLGDVSFVILDLITDFNGFLFPNIPDVLYLLYYPLIFWGLLNIPTQLADPTQKKTWLIDIFVITISISAVVWYFIIAPYAASGGDTWLAWLVAGAYPMLDVLILGSLTRILFQRSDDHTRQALLILSVGLFLYVVGDILYAQLVLVEQSSIGSKVDALFNLNYLLASLAGLKQAHLIEKPTSSNYRSLTSIASVLLLTALSISIGTSYYVAVTGRGTGIEAVGLFAGTAIAVFLTLTKQVVTNRENANLVQAVQTTTEQLKEASLIIKQHDSQRAQDLERQTQRLHHISQIARNAATARDVESLLNRSAFLIHDQYNALHTAIYLLDEKGETVVISASPTEAGQALLAEQFKVTVGEAGILGRVAATREPIILHLLDQNLIQNNKSLMSSAKSTMAMPLKAENSLIGILDIQSEEPNVFQPDEITALQILTDQLATAIERARLLQQVEQNLNELEHAYGRYTQAGWQNISGQARLKNRGYRFDNVRIEPINAPSTTGAQALTTGQIIQAAGSEQLQEVAIPVQLRGQTIGVVSVKLKEGYSENTITTLQLAIERLASALESARLYEEATQRADREQAISQITSAINASSNYEDILRATVREVGNMLNDSEVAIQIIEDIDEQASA